MEYNKIIQAVNENLKSIGIQINENNYDGIIIKKLETTNTLDDGRNSKQTHIAITGRQMDIFPYLKSDGYYYNNDSSLKKYFILQIPVIIKKENINYLNPQINKSSEDILTYTSVLRSRRVNQADQIQVSLINMDGEKFIDFRRLIHSGDYLIILKKERKFEYEFYGVKSKDVTTDLVKYNNCFEKKNTKTMIKIDDYIMNGEFLSEMNEENIKEEVFETNYKTKLNTKFDHNRILFGAPGTGKSYKLNEDKKDLLKDGGGFERVTFHPDYSYAHFVGTYKPISNECGEISYEYVPGPFMRSYVAAMKSVKTDNPKPYLLIIEEINRANVAGVFGDVFQLLDRNSENISVYPIQTSDDMRKYLVKELGGVSALYNEIKIPNNMFIWATMNSADQGVYPMDTAFKRRWNFTYLGINDSEEGIKGEKVHLGKGEYERQVEWNELRKAINIELLEECKVNEDKLLGPYFVAKNCLDSNEKFIEVFKNKIIMYLFDDAAKHRRSMIFSGCDTSNIYSEICKEFDDKGVFIFSEKVQEKFPNKIELNEDSENMRYEKTDRNFGIAEVAETNFKDED